MPVAGASAGGVYTTSTVSVAPAATVGGSSPLTLNAGSVPAASASDLMVSGARPRFCTEKGSFLELSTGTLPNASGPWVATICGCTA